MGKVYHVPWEEGGFPVDLVKEEGHPDPLYGKRTCLQHAIAGLLFPGEFIELRGWEEAEDYPSCAQDRGGVIFYTPKHLIYSVMADVPLSHAIYAAHATYSVSNEIKISACGCGTCENHRQFHEENRLVKRAREAAIRMFAVGIDLPYEDPTDYCLSPSSPSGLIFFEIEGFKPRKMEQYLRALPSPTPDQQLARELLKRYRRLR